MMMTAYYNDSDPYCAALLRNLIATGHLPAGDVDERDIREVRGDDVRGYTQVHFFAGIRRLAPRSPARWMARRQGRVDRLMSLSAAFGRGTAQRPCR